MLFLSLAGIAALLLGYFDLSKSEAPIAIESACASSPCETLQTSQQMPLLSGESGRCPYCGQSASFWRNQTDVAPPLLSVQSATVIEAECGTMLYGLRESQRLPPASLTKIVTAMVVAEQANLKDSVTIAVNGWDLVTADGSSVMGLEAGMSLTVQDLLYGLLLPSGNDAALALAEYLGGSQRLVELMNRRVERLGLANTRFVNPDGRDAEGQYSSALDLALLGREFLADASLRKIAASPSYRPQWPGGVLWNGNYLLQTYPGATGVKIGFTDEAGYTIVASAKRDGRELIAAVLGSSDINTDASLLLDWAFLNTQRACNSKN